MIANKLIPIKLWLFIVYSKYPKLFFVYFMEDYIDHEDCYASDTILQLFLYVICILLFVHFVRPGKGITRAYTRRIRIFDNIRGWDAGQEDANQSQTSHRMMFDVMMSNEYI